MLQRLRIAIGAESAFSSPRNQNSGNGAFARALGCEMPRPVDRGSRCAQVTDGLRGLPRSETAKPPRRLPVADHVLRRTQRFDLRRERLPPRTYCGSRWGPGVCGRRDRASVPRRARRRGAHRPASLQRHRWPQGAAGGGNRLRGPAGGPGRDAAAVDAPNGDVRGARNRIPTAARQEQAAGRVGYDLAERDGERRVANDAGRRIVHVRARPAEDDHARRSRGELGRFRISGAEVIAPQLLAGAGQRIPGGLHPVGQSPRNGSARVDGRGSRSHDAAVMPASSTAIAPRIPSH